jgi:hypothetical protein
LFDSGARPENLNIGPGVTVQSRDIKSPLRIFWLSKNLWIARSIGMD